MTHIKYFLLTMMVALVSSISAYAYDFKVDGIYYKKQSNSEVYVTYLASPSHFRFTNVYSGNIVIPETVEYEGKRYNVTGIGEGAFNNSEELESITIPPSITEIGKGAFNWCSNLKEVIIQDSAEPLKFYKGYYTKGDYGYTTQPFVDSPIDYLYIGRDYSLDTSGGTMYMNFSEKVKVVEFGNYVTEAHGFEDCSALEQVRFSSSIKSISGFNCCTSLKEIYIPDNVVSLNGFSSCENLVNVYCGNGIESINWCFRYCTNLRNIYILSEKLSQIDGNALYNNSTATIFVPNPSQYVTLLADYNVESLITIANSTVEYTGKAPVLNYNNKVQGAEVSFSSETMNVNVGHYNADQEVRFTVGDWTSSCKVPCEYTITKAPLTVVANDAVREYGEENPAFACSYLGFKNDEDVSVLTKLPTFSTNATTSSVPGTYYINMYGAEADNYSFNYERGTLTITKAKNLLTWEQEIEPMEIGATVSIAFNAKYNNAKPIFEDYDTDIISIVRNGDGWDIKAKAPGTTTIAMYMPGNDLYEQSNIVTKQITVNEPTVVEAEAITLNKTSLTLDVSEFEMLTATVMPENTSDKTVIWTSLDESVAKVLSNGTVIALGDGKTFIVATCGKASAVCSVTVTSLHKLTYFVDGEEYYSEKLKCGAAIVPQEAPTKEGYAFCGWSTIPANMPDKDVVVTGMFYVEKVVEVHDTIYIYDDVCVNIQLENSEAITFYVRNGVIYIENVPVGETIAVYNPNGVEVKCLTVDDIVTEIRLARHSVYIIRTCGKAFKISI